MYFSHFRAPTVSQTLRRWDSSISRRLCCFMNILFHYLCLIVCVTSPFLGMCCSRTVPHDNTFHFFSLGFPFFLILPRPDLSFHFFFCSISLILLGPLTAQPNYNTFLIFRSLFAHALSALPHLPSCAFHLPQCFVQCRPELQTILDKVVFLSLWR